MTRKTSDGWSGFFEQVAAVLRHTWTRSLLSIAIVVSLLPVLEYPSVDVFMLVLFSVEFAARAALMIRREGLDPEQRQGDEPAFRVPRSSEVALLAVDLVALLSFVPWQTGFVDARWLRVFRLARLLLLLRYWAPLARDLWPVAVRQERGRQVALLGVLVLTASFTGAVFLDHVLSEPGADFDGDEVITENDAQIWARMWWAFRQVQDPGNMLASPNNGVAILVSLGLTVCGLFLVSFLIGLGTDVVREVLERSRLRPPGLRQHTVVFHYTTATRILLEELSRHYEKVLDGVESGEEQRGRLVDRVARWFARARRRFEQMGSGNRYVVVGHGDDPPDGLRKASSSQVVWRSTSADHELMLDRSDVDTARRVIVLADPKAEDPDDVTIRTMLAIAARVDRPRDHGAKGARDAETTRVVAEILDESNVPAARMAVQRVGEQVFGSILPTERLMGLYLGALVRSSSICALLDELLTTRGKEIYCFDYGYPRHEIASDAAFAEGTVVEAFTRAFAAGLELPPPKRVVTIGVISDHVEAYRPRIYLEPTKDVGAGARVRGFVGVATSFATMQSFARQRLEWRAQTESTVGLSRAPDAAGDRRVSPARDAPLIAEAPTALRRVLVCGWRVGTVNVLEAILVAEPQAEVLVMVDGGVTVDDVLDDLDSHRNLVKKKMLHGYRSYFELETPSERGEVSVAVLRQVSHDGERSPGRVVVRRGDRTSTRALADLDGLDGLDGHSISMTMRTVAEVDLVILLADPRTGDDARTITACMKIESILRLQCVPGGSQGECIQRSRPLRLIAEVEEERLARQLMGQHDDGTRRREDGRHASDLLDVFAFSVQRLRASFLHQAVAVPHFYGIFAELLAPVGKSIVAMTVPDGAVVWSGKKKFAALVRELWERGEGILIGADVAEANGTTTTLLGEGSDETTDELELERLLRLWMIRPDPVTRDRDGGG